MTALRLFALIGMFCACAHSKQNALVIPGFTDPTPANYRDPSPTAFSGPEKIVFDSPVEPMAVAVFALELQRHIMAGDRNVVVELDTPGGMVSAGREMAKAIEDSPVPVVCVVDGMAASMGLYILEACDVRVMTRRSILMGHEPSGSFTGQPTEAGNAKARLEALSKMLAAHIVAKSKMSVAEYLEKTSGGTELCLSFDEAERLGLVDFTVERVVDVAVRFPR